MIRTLAVVAIALTFGAALPAMAVDVGEDGLHKPDWLRETFKDMREDLEEATAEGKRLMVIWEQRGCIYCTRMQTEILPLPQIDAVIREHYFVVQMNLFGDVEVTDFDGTTLAEKDMARRWGVLFTPTLMFFPEEVPEGAKASEAAVATMPGAFGPITTQALLEWVVEKGYEGGEHFQRYVASKVSSLSD
ncbi:MAG: thioredoxin family protein [Gemmobacter sp.]